MKTDYLIVGQGLAGTLLAYRLAKAGKSICFINAPEQTAASAVAAGIINPITGRRFVKSWNIEALIPAANELYAALESILGLKLHHHLPLVRSIHNSGDQNFWDIRGGDPSYQPYLNDHPELGQLKAVTTAAFNYGGIHHSSRVDLGLLVKAYRQCVLADESIKSPLFARQRMVLATFDYDQLKINEKKITYNDIEAQRVIFCEGWRARFNPWFNYLPHRGAKGEVLIAKIDDRMPQMMFKHQVFLVPQTERLHWIGATADNQFADDSPSEEGKNRLLSKLSNVLKTPYTIENHLAAVRPTVKDRRPILGPHPKYHNLFIFNGLGTKGTSLAPLCSLWLANFLLQQQAIPHEVNINRFSLH